MTDIRRAAFVVVMAMALLTRAAAQTQDQQPAGSKAQPPKDQVPSPPRFESAVVVTATRSEVTPESAPASTDVVTPDELKLRNVQTLDQALNLLEGVYVFRGKGIADQGTRLHMRGFNGANRTLVLLDGQPLNDAYTGEFSWTSLPTQGLERIEVARGSFSALYGGNAMGGVINILTKPVDAREMQATAQYGTYRTADYGAQYTDRLFGRLGVMAGFQRLTTGGYRNRDITVAPGTGAAGIAAAGAVRSLTPTGGVTYVVGAGGDNWYQQSAARLRLEFAAKPTTLVSAHYVLQDSEYGYDPYESFLRDDGGSVIDRGPVLVSDAGVVRQLSLTPGTFLQGPGDSRSHLVNVAFRRAAAKFVVQVSTGLSSQPDNATRTAAAATATLDGGPGAISVRDSRSYHTTAQVTTTFGGRGELVAGFEHHREWSDNSEHALSNWTDRNSLGAQTFQSHGDTANVAAYGQARWELGARAGVTGGVRVDRWRTFDGLTDIFNAAVPRTVYEPRDNRSVTGKLSIVAQPATAWTLRGSVGRAFRNATVFELYRTFRLSTGTVFYANPDLQPERNVGLELGVARRFGSSSVEAAFFRNQTTGLIYRKTDLQADPSGRARVLVNAGEGTTNGVELAGRLQLARWLQLRAQYSYTGAVISRNPAVPETEGKRVPFIPDHMASAALFGAREPWTGSLTGRYVSGTFGLDNNLDTTKGVMGSYSPHLVVSASLSRAVRRSVQVFASADNLLNGQYYVFYLNPGRTLTGGVRLQLRKEPS